MSLKRHFFVLLVACTCAPGLHAQQDTVRMTEPAPVRAPRLDTTAAWPGPVEKGIASWYGKAFEGRITSSGERFHADSLTAAHKTLPFGTLVRVTNLENDSVVIVKITDRLPKNSKRAIDLTSGAAKRLHFLRAGITPVTIEIVGIAPINVARRTKAVASSH